MGLLPSWSTTDALALRYVVSSCKRQYHKSYFANRPTSIYSQSLIVLYWIVRLHHLRQCISDLWHKTHWGTWCNHTTLSTGLLQCCTIEGTADIVIKRLQLVQNTAFRLISGIIFLDHYHYFTQPPPAFGVAQNCFQEHNPVSTYVNSA